MRYRKRKGCSGNLWTTLVSESFHHLGCREPIYGSCSYLSSVDLGPRRPRRVQLSTSTIVFIPTSAERAHQLVAAPGKQVTAFTVTEELQSILDVTDPEETEHAAMVIGSVWGLTHTGRRLVLVAHVPSEQITDHEEVDNGGVTLTHLEPSQITAWFADDDDAHSREAAEAVKGMTIDDAWNDVTIQTLIGEHELSWHDVTEELPAVSTDPEGFRGLE